MSMFNIRLLSRIGAAKPLNSQLRVHCRPSFPSRRMATGHLNRLAIAKSPYLRQHATNPVDWYPFEKAALDKAKAENKVPNVFDIRLTDV